MSIYARESDDDTNKAPSIELQIERGLKWIEENQHTMSGVYQDNGFSGGDWKRPDWNQLVNDAKRHNFNMVWTWNQDRLARDTEQFLWFYRMLKGANVQVYSDTEGIVDMESAGGRIKHTALAMASEAFRIITSEKVKKVYARKKQEAQKQGLKHFWGRKPINLPLDEIRALKQAGLGYKTIAKRLSERGIKVSYITIKNKLDELKNTHKKLDISKTEKLVDLKNNPIV